MVSTDLVHVHFLLVKWIDNRDHCLFVNYKSTQCPISSVNKWCKCHECFFYDICVIYIKVESVLTAEY